MATVLTENLDVKIIDGFGFSTKFRLRKHLFCKKDDIDPTLLIRRMVTAVKEPAEAQVANSFETWLSSNGMRVSSREV